MSGLRFVRRAAALDIPVVIVNQGETRGDPLATCKVAAPLGETLAALLGLAAHLGERYGGIGELVGVDDGPARDEWSDLVRHVPDVDVHRGQDVVLTVEPERHELPPAEVAAHHDPRVGAGRGVTDVLHAEVVLVAEEVRQSVVDVGCRRAALPPRPWAG